MKNLIYFLILSSFLFFACSKDEPIENPYIKQLSILPGESSYVNEKGLPYEDSVLNSITDKHVYKLVMEKGVTYRVSTTQDLSEINILKLTLTRSNGDTVVQSTGEIYGIRDLYLKAPESTSYYLTIGINNTLMPQFDYRFFFEKIEEKNFLFAGMKWSGDPVWKNVDTNKLSFQGYDSRVNRFIKLDEDLSGYPNVSFVIQSTAKLKPKFGFILESSNEHISTGIYAYQFASFGYAFIANPYSGNFSLMDLHYGGFSAYYTEFNFHSLDFNKGIQIELKAEGTNQYNVYLDNQRISSVKGSIKNFNLFVQDRGDGLISIRNFIIE